MCRKIANLVLIMMMVAGFPKCAVAQDSGVLIDDFGRKLDPSPARYAPDPRARKSGFNIYYDLAEATITTVPARLSDDRAGLRIVYLLPVHHLWGNWLTLRREFDQVRDLDGCTGVALDLRVLKPSSCRLRIGLADLTASARRDEVWWGDTDIPVLADSDAGWVTVTIPFQDFRRSRGEGTSFNDGRLDLSRLCAYEISFISPAGEKCEGAVKIGQIMAIR